MVCVVLISNYDFSATLTIRGDPTLYFHLIALQHIKFFFNIFSF